MGRTYRRLDQRERLAADLAGPKPTFVLFHMNGCPYCDEMMPDWMTVERKLKDQARVYRVERSAMPPSLAESVMSFPTIAIVSDGRIVDKFEDPDRSWQNMVRFYKAHARAAHTTHKTTARKTAAAGRQQQRRRRRTTRKRAYRPLV